MLRYYNIFMRGFLIPSHLSYLQLLLSGLLQAIFLGHEKGQSLHETTVRKKLKTGFLLAPASVFK